MQELYSATKIINKLIEFCEKTNPSKEIFHDNGYYINPTKRSNHYGTSYQPALLAKSKVSKQTVKSLKEYAKNKINNKHKPTFPLNGPGHDLSSCKAIQAQEKSMKATWLYFVQE